LNGLRLITKVWSWTNESIVAKRLAGFVLALFCVKPRSSAQQMTPHKSAARSGSSVNDASLSAGGTSREEDCASTGVSRWLPTLRAAEG
jgi:hypothetical protein